MTKKVEIPKGLDLNTDLTESIQKNNTNAFPVNVFPLPVRNIILDTNQNLNFSIDFIGASMLYAISVAIGNTHKVEMKNGWEESAALYLAIVGRSGTNKSHPLSFALKPLMNKDAETYREYLERKLEYDRIDQLSKQEKEMQSVEKQIKPVWEKFLLSDFTPEALAEVHKFNKRGVGVYVDELAGWFKNFQRYNKGSEMEFWLSVWSNKPINIDRKSGEPIFIPMPFISVAGTIQEGLLNELAKENRTQNGFIERILYVIPENIKKEYWSDTEPNPASFESWNNIILNLLDPVDTDSNFNPIPKILKFTPEAKEALYQWQKSNADECNSAESDDIKGIYSKLEIYAIRLSLILEMLKYACNESEKNTISIDSVIGALELIKYFKNSAIKVHSFISNTSPLDKLPADKQALYKSLPDNFKTEIGLKIAEELDVPERTFKRFLNDQNLFQRVKVGEYEKLF